MGFYPFNPCGGEYVIGAPQVPQATLNLANGKTFTVTARNLSKSNKYVKTAGATEIVTPARAEWKGRIRIMLDYYGTELLKNLKDYYAGRLSQAVKNGYDRDGNKYKWLYDELKQRVLIIRQTLMFIDTLPLFIREESDEEKLFSYVYAYTDSLFSPGELGEKGKNQSPYFSDENPLWIDMQEALKETDEFGKPELLPVLYLNLSEYVVRSIRMYLKIREDQSYAIDKNRFDELISQKEYIIRSE